MKKKSQYSFEDLLVEKEEEIFSLRNSIGDFLDKPHSINGNKEAMLEVRKADAGITTILLALSKEQKTRREFKSVAAKLSKRCTNLRDETRDMQKWLTEDLSELRREQIDVVKNTTFLFALPASFVLIVKNVGMENFISLKQALGTGFAVSTSVLGYKKVAKSFRENTKLICGAPKRIRQSYTLFYLKQKAKEAVETVNKAPKIIKKDRFLKILKP